MHPDDPDWEPTPKPAGDPRDGAARHSAGDPGNGRWGSPSGGRAEGPADDPVDDPTYIRSQPALTTSTGRIWLIVGGVFALVSFGVLVAMAVAGLPPVGVAAVGAIVVAACYAGMIATQVKLEPGRRRLRLQAVLMLTMAAVALVAAIIVAAAAAGDLQNALNPG